MSSRINASGIHSFNCTVITPSIGHPEITWRLFAYPKTDIEKTTWDGHSALRIFTISRNASAVTVTKNREPINATKITRFNVANANVSERIFVTSSGIYNVTIICDGNVTTKTIGVKAPRDYGTAAILLPVVFLCVGAALLYSAFQKQAVREVPYAVLTYTPGK